MKTRQHFCNRKFSIHEKKINSFSGTWILAFQIRHQFLSWPSGSSLRRNMCKSKIFVTSWFIRNLKKQTLKAFLIKYRVKMSKNFSAGHGLRVINGFYLPKLDEDQVLWSKTRINLTCLRVFWFCFHLWLLANAVTLQTEQ